MRLLAATYYVSSQGSDSNDGSQGSLDTRVSTEQIDQLLRGPLQAFVPRRPREVNYEAWACNCARGNLAITATGDVHPCVSVPSLHPMLRGAGSPGYRSTPSHRR